MPHRGGTTLITEATTAHGIVVTVQVFMAPLVIVGAHHTMVDTGALAIIIHGILTTATDLLIMVRTMVTTGDIMVVDITTTGVATM